MAYRACLRSANAFDTGDPLLLAPNPYLVQADRVRSCRCPSQTRFTCVDLGEVFLDPLAIGHSFFGVCFVLTFEFFERFLDVGGTAFAGCELLWQLTRTSVVGVGRVLSSISSARVADSVASDPPDLVSRPFVGPVADIDPFAAILVPSIEITPTLTIPASAHNRRTCANRSANLSWYVDSVATIVHQRNRRRSSTQAACPGRNPDGRRRRSCGLRGTPRYRAGRPRRGRTRPDPCLAASQPYSSEEETPPLALDPTLASVVAPNDWIEPTAIRDQLTTRHHGPIKEQQDKLGKPADAPCSQQKSTIQLRQHQPAQPISGSRLRQAKARLRQG